MRIKFFALKINLISGGGSHHSLDLKLRFLVSRGHEISLTTILSDENKFETPPPYKIIEKKFKGGFLDMQNYVCRMLKQENEKTDLFHLDGSSFIWGGGMYKQLGGKIPTIAFINNYTAGMGITHKDYQNLPLKEKVLLMARDWLYVQKRYLWEKFIGLKYVNQLDAILFDSPVIKQLFKNFGFREEKLRILPEFVDLDNLLKIRPSQKIPFEKRAKGLYLLYAGRLTFDKGVDLLIEAIKDVAKKDNIFLNVVGSGPQKDYISKLINQYNLNDYIKIFPWATQDQLAQFYANSDLLVHPCRWPEPFGITIVEAMAFGKPVITASYSGSSWVADGAGLTFKNGDINDLKNKILIFANNRNLLRDYELKAKMRAKKMDYKSYAEKFEKFLLKLGKKRQ